GELQIAQLLRRRCATGDDSGRGEIDLTAVRILQQHAAFDRLDLEAAVSGSRCGGPTSFERAYGRLLREGGSRGLRDLRRHDDLRELLRENCFGGSLIERPVQ